MTRFFAFITHRLLLRKEGQALFEILVAVAIVVLLAFALMVITTTSLNSHSSAKVRGIAAGLSAETIEAIRQIAYSDDQQSQGWNRIYCPPYGNCAGEFPATFKTDEQFHIVSANTILGGSNISGSGVGSCIINSDSSIWCWGANATGRLGNGTIIDSDIPVQVANLEGAVDVASGPNHSCAVRQDGTAWCWGSDAFGQLGNDAAYVNQLSAVQVSGISAVIAITVGLNHSCALLQDTTVSCWGVNSSGQLGDGTTNQSPLPVVVEGLSNVTDVIASYTHTCAITREGMAYCWGADSQGQLGNDSLFENKNKPVAVEGLSQVVAIGTGDLHTCAVLQNGTAWCWGDNDKGQLGNGTASALNYPIPQQVANVSDAVEIEGGGGAFGGHSCALLRTGAVWCWGDDSNGQVGDDQWIEATPILIPFPVASLPTVASLSLGALHSCVSLRDGRAMCWGNSGSLGDGQSGDQPLPVFVEGYTQGEPTLNKTILLPGFGPETIWRGERSFTRYFIVENVCREGGIGTDAISGVWQADPATECAAGSYDDPWTQRVTVFVKTRGIQDIVMSQYLTRSRNVASNQTQWSQSSETLEVNIRDFPDLTPPTAAYDVAHNPVSGKFGVVDIYAGQLRFALCPDANCTGPAEAVTIVEASAVSGDGGGPYLTFNGLGNPVFSYTKSVSGFPHAFIAACSSPTCSGSITKRDINISITASRGGPIMTAPDGNATAIAHIQTTTGFRVYHCTNATCSAGTTAQIATAEKCLCSPSVYTIIKGATGFPIITYGAGGLHLLRCTTNDCSVSSAKTFDVGAQEAIWVPGSGPEADFPRFVSSVSGVRILKACGDANCTTIASQTTLPLGATDSIVSSSRYLRADGTPFFVTYRAFSATEQLRIIDCKDALCANYKCLAPITAPEGTNMATPRASLTTDDQLVALWQKSGAPVMYRILSDIPTIEISTVRVFEDQYYNADATVSTDPLISLVSGAVSGQLVSDILDTQTAPTGSGPISLTWRGQPGTGKVRLQFGSSDTSCVTKFYGPNGSSGAWFETTEGTPVQICPSGVNVNATTCAHYNKRYIRYKIELCARPDPTGMDCGALTGGETPPTIEQININWAR